MKFIQSGHFSDSPNKYGQDYIGGTKIEPRSVYQFRIIYKRLTIDYDHNGSSDPDMCDSQDSCLRRF